MVLILVRQFCCVQYHLLILGTTSGLVDQGLTTTVTEQSSKTVRNEQWEPRRGW